MGIFSVRCRYSTMNIAMFYHFVPIIIISGYILLCSSIMTIMLTLVVSSRLWLIIRWIMLSTRLPITIQFSFTEVTYLWNFYISANWWKVTLIAGLVPIIIISSSSSGDFVLVLINIFGRVWCTVKWNIFVVVVLVEHS